MLAVCTTISAWLLGSALMATPLQDPDAALESPPAVQEIPDYVIPPDGYNSPEAIAQELEDLAAAHANVSLIEIGQTNDAYPLRIASFIGADSNASAVGLPAILVVANLEGDRLATSEVALSLCRHLASGEAEILKRAQVFVMPVANPDAAMRAFRGDLPWRGAPTDNDRDGRVDEDGPFDLNDDGNILWMRVANPNGTLLIDEQDDRVSREADASASEAGVFELLREGSDLDGDRARMEDGLGGVKVEANFPHRWRQYAPEAGRFQLSEVESRALVDFVLMHPSIALAVVLDDEDNLAKPPSGGSSTDKNSTDPREDDAALLKILGKRFHDSDDFAKPRSAEHGSGNFADWLYFQRGILVLESALWSAPLDVDPPEESGAEDSGEGTGMEEAPAEEAEPARDLTDEHKLLIWADAWYRGAAFQDWQVFEHEKLGAVEIGGWHPLVLNNPPAELLPELGTHFNSFIDSLANDLPQLRWSVEVTALDNSGVFEARAFLVCDGLLPTMTAMGRATRKQMPIRVGLELPEGGELLVGRGQSAVERLDGLGDNSEFHWIYRIPARGDAARIRATSKTAGEALTVLEVK
ncbi:MAG: hypothetical protein GY879_07015 [Planctomycetes bacterium]|nr:hypothetical protein [Planctomycetota bacterium]MCP4862130.1 hypothetical protein [Planctomycetota bacterium]